MSMATLAIRKKNTAENKLRSREKAIWTETLLKFAPE
jgi:hypothetical protein